MEINRNRNADELMKKIGYEFKARIFRRCDFESYNNRVYL